ncbi:unnamed protein product [Blepharisma stoltei]|uniref:Uncharacterized protein n=1 Tax=Blepharisma stoltei TaxID=1481888 RepID=A0AAU9INI5_9CILI|nr:unnamed protein product [Blepharisma stoltei]
MEKHKFKHTGRASSMTNIKSAYCQYQTKLSHKTMHLNKNITKLETWFSKRRSNNFRNSGSFATQLIIDGSTDMSHSPSPQQAQSLFRTERSRFEEDENQKNLEEPCLLALSVLKKSTQEVL